MRIIVDKGCGVKIDFTNLTSSYLRTVIEQVLETPSYLENAKRMSRILRDQPESPLERAGFWTDYLENAKRMSRILRDQPESPLERAVFWTEYVIRHKGAAHLRSSSLDLYWFQYLFLDVLLIVVITLLALELEVAAVWGVIIVDCTKGRGCKECSRGNGYYLQCTQPESSPDIPVFGSLVQHESSALDHVATERVTQI
uniref:UDP-glycosyltransferase n=1 Tax=Timema bartmani TaxID=61472 RepID=A0A7R9F633_9NEOP|nr:unnamed protein product [Timema bartmani]